MFFRWMVQREDIHIYFGKIVPESVFVRVYIQLEQARAPEDGYAIRTRASQMTAFSMESKSRKAQGTYHVVDQSQNKVKVQKRHQNCSFEQLETLCEGAG